MPAIVYDVFPANIIVTPKNPESGQPLTEHAFEIGASRVVVTDTTVYVAIDSPTGPVLVLDLPYSPQNFQKANSMYEDSMVQTDTGQTLVFKKDDSCGCGSRLRGWNPYRSIVANG